MIEFQTPNDLLQSIATPEKEREILLARIFNKSATLLELALEVGLLKRKTKEELKRQEKKELRALIAKHATSEQAFRSALERLDSDAPTHGFIWFRGQHYHVEFLDGQLVTYDPPAEEFHERVREKVREVGGDPEVRALLRGIIASGFRYGAELGGGWGQVIGEGETFYDGADFYPTGKFSVVNTIPGTYTDRTDSGRWFGMAAELAPIVWEVLDQLEQAEAAPLPPPEKKVPEHIAKRKPKFQEIFEAVEVTSRDIQKFKRILENHDALDYWSDYIAPGVKFRSEAKKAILCMLASPEDKHGNKGRTNVLIYGPPGTGKTEFKNFLTRKFGAYSIDGARVSRADLTYNKATGEDGLLVRAHKGLAVIEEADEMDPNVLGAALTSLGESGKVEIRDMELPAEVRGIMLGNFESHEEILGEWGAPALNRFEFIIKFERLDKRELDETLEWHYRHFRKPKPKTDATYLKKYLKWVRDFEPEIAELEEILKYKEEHIDGIENVRKGISIMSVAFTIARLNHRDVTLEDYKTAIQLITRR